MIVTVTLNPSVDRALDIEALNRGRVIRATDTHLDPGGKGVNVSRALVANGVRSRAIIPVGGEEGGQLCRLLVDEGVELATVPITGRTRSNITLVERDGKVTKVNESGPTLSQAEFDAVTAQALAAADDADWIVVSGRMAPGVDGRAFHSLCSRLVATGVPLAVDTSGTALQLAAEAGATLLKPNRHELSEVVGHTLVTTEDIVRAAERLRAAGAASVLASLGAGGAVLVDAISRLHGRPPTVRPRSSVGAGDAMLAGYLAAGAQGPTALTEALAWGSAAAGLPGSRMPSPSNMNREGVRITEMASTSTHADNEAGAPSSRSPGTP